MTGRSGLHSALHRGHQLCSLTPARGPGMPSASSSEPPEGCSWRRGGAGQQDSLRGGKGRKRCRRVTAGQQRQGVTRWVQAVQGTGSPQRAAPHLEVPQKPERGPMLPVHRCPGSPGPTLRLPPACRGASAASVGRPVCSSYTPALGASGPAVGGRGVETHDRSQHQHRLWPPVARTHARTAGQGRATAPATRVPLARDRFKAQPTNGASAQSG